MKRGIIFEFGNKLFSFSYRWFFTFSGLEMTLSTGGSSKLMPPTNELKKICAFKACYAVLIQVVQLASPLYILAQLQQQANNLDMPPI
jgi:hypothetical protein